MAGDHSCKDASCNRSAQDASCGQWRQAAVVRARSGPWIIATRRVDILEGSEIAAIGCSTEFDEPLTPSEVPLPYDPEGKVVTGLRQAKVAFAIGSKSFPLDQGFETGGMVSGALLRLIFETAGIVVPPER